MQGAQQQHPAAGLRGQVAAEPRHAHDTSAEACVGWMELESAGSSNRVTLDQLCNGAAQQCSPIRPWHPVRHASKADTFMMAMPWHWQQPELKADAARLLPGLTPTSVNELQHLRSWLSAVEAKSKAATPSERFDLVA